MSMEKVKLNKDEKELAIAAINSKGKASIYAQKKNLKYFQKPFVVKCLKKFSSDRKIKPAYRKQAETLARKL